MVAGETVMSFLQKSKKTGNLDLIDIKEEEFMQPNLKYTYEKTRITAY